MRLVGLIGLAALTVGLGVYGGASALCRRTVGELVEPPMPPAPVAPAGVGGVALFHGWPKDVKPDAVVILSGQTYGHLQPCGCSRPQMGGFERRANFIAGLKAKGWPVAGADLGDIYPDRHPLGLSGVTPPTDQATLKYTAAMNALRDMGYVAVGAGKTEFSAGLLNVVAAYSLQKEQPPFLLAGNVVGLADGKPVPRAAFFPAPPGGKRPVVGLAEVFDVGAVPVGFVGVVGPTVAKDAEKADSLLGFEGNKGVLTAAVAALAAHAKKPAVTVLLYQGTADEAKKVAADFPDFQVVLCQADDPEPPQFPEVVAHADGRKTLVVQVGHKGRYVGAVGAFKKPDGSFDLKYQLVPLGEEYLTPEGPAAEKDSKVLVLLEEYARQVRERNFLAKVPQNPHTAQLRSGKVELSYVGAEACRGCHAAEYLKWSGTKHGHAYDALEKVAKRPGLRNFDAECAVCHTVGLGYKTGFAGKDKTPLLLHNGCENCHGPGSGHAANGTAPDLLKLQTPWKQDKTDKLPDVATMEKMATRKPGDPSPVTLTPTQQRVVNAVQSMCMKCHDGENDPHFDIFKYWPQVAHSGLANNGGLPVVPKKKK